MNFRRNSEDHQFVGKVLGIYRGRTSSGYFDGLSDGPILGSSDGPILGSSDEMFLRIFIRNFRGTEPSENSEEGVPRYIPRKESLESVSQTKYVLRYRCDYIDGLVSSRSFGRARSPRSDRAERTLGRYVAIELGSGSVAT
ncbi:hypothetical protein F2Q68_00015982 [Brassica cretica]|uniref:Uncharacterized protein n=1 Tax=Brassica cretica TaxID=69181 RepID=A0A8S9HJZ6_BRACR|nr:hypothetical protein F2Q68_00015982 [Brassica cretica]